MNDLPSHFIDGQWVSGGIKPIVSINPATGEILWSGYEANAAMVDKAIISAQQSFDRWSQCPIEERIKILKNFSIILNKQQETLAVAISKENGKPLWDALNEVKVMISKVDISINAYHIRCAEIKQQQAFGVSITRHRPHGVMGVLGPFNFPGHIPNGHIIPALLAGNTIVFKPSEITPMVAEMTVKYWEQAGIPKGVINLVQGGRETGEALIRHKGVDGILFTGSWNTGKTLAEALAKTPHKILALEMGGNNPLIIASVKDTEAAAYLTIQSAFLSAGQRCTCARRLIITEGKHRQPFLDALISMTKNLKIGAYFDVPEPFMGPVISENAARHLIEVQKNLQKIGGVSLLSSHILDRGPAFISPGIIDMTGTQQLADEEYFGPFLQVFNVKTVEDAIEEANNTDYGLTAGIFSDEKYDYELFYRKIKAGLVNWNTPLTGASSAAPFGGIGHSGNNRPSAFYAADYCAYPVASVEAEQVTWPKSLAPGINHAK